MSRNCPSHGEFGGLYGSVVGSFSGVRALSVGGPHIKVIKRVLIGFLPTTGGRLTRLLRDRKTRTIIPSLLSFLLCYFCGRGFGISRLKVGGSGTATKGLKVGTLR